MKRLILSVSVMALIVMVMGLLVICECRSWAQPITNQGFVSYLIEDDPNEPQPEMGLIKCQLSEEPDDLNEEPEASAGEK